MSHPLPRRSFLHAGIAAAISGCLLLGGLQASAPDRVVAVGDIHGDARTFAALLKRAGLLDDGLNWIGGPAVLVQTGDYLDRGGEIRELMDLLIRIEAQARKAGGRAVILAGNHEYMNAMGDLRYVAPETFERFVDRKSEERRERAWRDYTRLVESRRQKLTMTGREIALPPVYVPDTKEAWMAAHPPGYLEYRRAFSADGDYGKWIRKRNVAERVGDTVFVHGGLDPDFTAPSLDEINEKARGELAKFDRLTTVMIRLGIALPFFSFNELMEAGRTELALITAELKDVTQRAGPRYGDDRVGNERYELVELLKVGEWSITSPQGPVWFRGFASWSAEEGDGLVDRLQQQFGAVRFVVGHTQPDDRRIRTRFGGRIFLIDTALSSTYQDSRPAALEIAGGEYAAITDEGREVLVGGPEARN